MVINTESNNAVFIHASFYQKLWEHHEARDVFCDRRDPTRRVQNTFIE